MERDIIYGRNAVLEALRGDRAVKEVFISNSVPKGAFNNMTATLKARRIPFHFRSPEWLKRTANSDSHQGIVAIIDAVRYSSLGEILGIAKSREEPPFIIVLDGIEDPQNLGSIIRSAECAGAHGIIIPEHRAVGITPAVVRVAAGATEHMKVAIVDKISKILEELGENGVKVIGSDAQAKVKYCNVPMREGVAIVIGGEGEGMKRSTADACDVLVSIPLKGKLNSLNAAVSAAILMFEVVRQRSK